MAEDVIIRYGKYEIDARRMTEYVRQQQINEAERDRIIKTRHMYLDWMHVHFAERVLPPGAEHGE